MKHMANARFTLKEYGLMASALLSCFKVSADIIYTNPEPDPVLQLDDDFAYIDLDQNGSDELYFELHRFIYATDYYQVLYGNRLDLELPNPVNVEVAGSWFYNGSVLYSMVDTFRPYAIPFYYPVGIMMSFQDADWQVMGLIARTIDDNEVEHSLGHWVPVLVEQFIGVHFKSDDGNMHYGWVRCSVEDSLSKFIIHDFAYESEPERFILTGQTSGTYTDIHQTQPEAEIYSYNNLIYIKCDAVISNGDLQVEVFTMSGERIYCSNLAQASAPIELQTSGGIYLVKVSGEEFSTSKAIMLK